MEINPVNGAAQVQGGAQAQAQAQSSAQAAPAQPPAENAQAAAQNTAAQNAAAQAAAQATSSANDSSYNTIVSKVNQGRQLTSAELALLKERDPALYARAMKASKARQSLQAKMEEDPNHAAQQAREAISAVSRAAAGGDEDLAAVHRALSDEYLAFAARYDQVDFSTAPGGAAEEN